MSFKRDGDDKNLLSVLQKRRIRDLLAEDIPEEEAKLLSNGRFACLVCLHHPIFDTIAMLCIHRDGKKHKSYAQVHEKKKQELKQLILRRQQEQVSTDASITIPGTSSRHKGLSFSSPYDSRAQKYKVKKGGRRLQVDLHVDKRSLETSSSVNEFSSESTSESTQTNSSASSSLWHQTANQQLNGPIKHDFKLKNIFKVKSDVPVRISPYKSKSNRDNSRSIPNDISQSQTGHFKSDASSAYKINSWLAGNIESQNVVSNVPKQSSHCFNTNSSQLLHMPNFSRVEQCPYSSNLDGVHGHYGTESSSLNRKYVGECESKECTRKKESPRSSDNFKHTKGKTSCPDLAEKYYQLQGSGWKRDWDGKWIKDEQAEFDSDEEPPNIP